MTIDIEKLAVECGAVKANDVFSADDECADLIYFTPDQLQAFAEAYAEQENYILLGVIADIRMEIGVNEKPMLSDLANVAKDVKAENEALKHLLVDASQYVRNEYEENVRLFSDYPHKAHKLKDEKEFLDAIELALKVGE